MENLLENLGTIPLGFASRFSSKIFIFFVKIEKSQFFVEKSINSKGKIFVEILRFIEKINLRLA
jgi:hypothetical protein